MTYYKVTSRVNLPCESKLQNLLGQLNWLRWVSSTICKEQKVLVWDACLLSRLQPSYHPLVSCLFPHVIWGLHVNYKSFISLPTLKGRTRVLFFLPSVKWLISSPMNSKYLLYFKYFTGVQFYFTSKVLVVPTSQRPCSPKTLSFSELVCLPELHTMNMSWQQQYDPNNSHSVTVDLLLKLFIWGRCLA